MHNIIYIIILYHNITLYNIYYISYNIYYYSILFIILCYIINFITWLLLIYNIYKCITYLSSSLCFPNYLHLVLWRRHQVSKSNQKLINFWHIQLSVSKTCNKKITRNQSNLLVHTSNPPICINLLKNVNKITTVEGKLIGFFGSIWLCANVDIFIGKVILRRHLWL